MTNADKHLILGKLGVLHMLEAYREDIKNKYNGTDRKTIWAWLLDDIPPCEPALVEEKPQEPIDWLCFELCYWADCDYARPPCCLYDFHHELNCKPLTSPDDFNLRECANCLKRHIKEIMEEEHND